MGKENVRLFGTESCFQQVYGWWRNGWRWMYVSVSYLETNLPPARLGFPRSLQEREREREREREKEWKRMEDGGMSYRTLFPHTFFPSFFSSLLHFFFTLILSHSFSRTGSFPSLRSVMGNDDDTDYDYEPCPFPQSSLSLSLSSLSLPLSFSLLSSLLQFRV